ncbi:MAG: DMT family transporter, partial [Planctomycetota bacterium]|nr:DMT family transporter [Planctomycetota bacterium]
LVTGAVAIAFAPVFVRWSEVGPTATAFFRLALAVPILVLLARRGPRPAPPPTAKGPGWLLLLPGLCFALDLGFWHFSILYTTVANSTLLANLAPVFVTLGGWLLWRRRVRRLFLTGMALAIVGAALLVGASLELSGRRALGDGLGVLTAVFYGSYILSVGHLRSRVGAARIVAWAAGVAALLLLPVALGRGEVFWPVTLRGWSVVVGLALVTQVLGQGLIAWSLAHLPASFSSVALLVQPACVVLFGWIWFDETLGPIDAIGAVVMLAGILIARRGSDYSSGGGGRRNSSSSAASGVPGSAS